MKWLKRVFSGRYFFSKKISPEHKRLLAEAAKRTLETAEDAVEAKYVSLPTADAVAKLASAIGDLNRSTAEVDRAVIRLGPLLYIKFKSNGLTQIRTETITPRLARMLAMNPTLLSAPEDLSERIDKLAAGSNGGGIDIRPIGAGKTIEGEDPSNGPV